MCLLFLSLSLSLFLIVGLMNQDVWFHRTNIFAHASHGQTFNGAKVCEVGIIVILCVTLRPAFVGPILLKDLYFHIFLFFIRQF